jgi:spermidine/putrescine-binding protein
MNRKSLHWPALSLLMIVALLLAACGGSADSGSEKPAAPAADSIKTDSGFVCPPANPKMEVTAKELNLFAWTEYIPQDMTDCFEAIYGVKVNRDEYSSNEELYAKLSAGSASYDLVQPTDYIVELMVRQKLLQKLDKSKLPIMAALWSTKTKYRTSQPNGPTSGSQSTLAT